MGAPKGNNFAEKWTEEMAIKFFNSVTDQANKGGTYVYGEAVHLTLEEMSEEIGTERATSENICGYLKGKFKDCANVLGAIKRSEDKFAARVVDATMTGEAKSAAMAIFYLKNKHGYSDRTESHISMEGVKTINIQHDEATEKPD